MSVDYNKIFISATGKTKEPLVLTDVPKPIKIELEFLSPGFVNKLLQLPEDNTVEEYLASEIFKNSLKNDLIRAYNEYGTEIDFSNEIPKPYEEFFGTYTGNAQIRTVLKEIDIPDNSYVEIDISFIAMNFDFSKKYSTKKIYTFCKINGELLQRVGSTPSADTDDAYNYDGDVYPSLDNKLQIRVGGDNETSEIANWSYLAKIFYHKTP